ncbi:MAG: maleylpyruvate isomerase N-terminal domain-containing protein [Acidobacteriota bacterium]|nr:maleylpyruvate isomerase N-terminal domain-containing protein [Acidobacteriota bacterium]
MKPVQPIFVADLFGNIHDELLALLKGLSDEDWYKPTAAGSWLVRDIAAHLLDSDIRRLSYQRDNMPQALPDAPIENYGDLVGFLNQLNADWIKAARRISPQLLIEFLSLTGAQVAALLKSIDPFSPAIFSVAWAGEEASLHWFDVAREYTEKWHHQQQIRDAVGAPALYDRKWLHPVLDAFFRALPRNYHDAQAGEGTHITFTVTGEAGGEWTLVKSDNAWQLYTGASANAICQVRLDQDTAWRLMTKGLAREDAAKRIEVVGEKKFAEPLLSTLAVMA